MPWIERASYLERLCSAEGTGDIKVITVVRRSGKSELMKAFSAELAKRDPSSNNLYIDLLDLDNEELLEYHALHDRIAACHKDGVRNRLFIDEVQRCEGFERAINSIHARGGWDIYLTGSNAFLLSSDLATLFTGRHREIHVLPFSFSEFRAYFGEQGFIDEDLDRYIERGGLAGSLHPGERRRERIRDARARARAPARDTGCLPKEPYRENPARRLHDRRHQNHRYGPLAHRGAGILICGTGARLLGHTLSDCR